MNKIGENVVEEVGKASAGKAVDLLVDKFITPKLEKLFNAPKDIFVLYDLFREYLNKKYENDKYMNTIVFRTESKTLDDLYVPLTIMQNGKRTRIVVDENMNNIFENPNKMLIIDTAGTGKSTIVKFLSLLCIKREWGFPFVVELRRVDRTQNIEDYIIKEIQLNNTEITEIDIKDILRRGDFVFFFDGYDEILEENKLFVTKAIRKFMTYAGNNNFVLTSREDDCLSEFSDFLKYHIKELNKQEAYELIKKYDNCGEVSEALINEIEKNKNYEALEEFLGNPLMVSLLYLTYCYKGVLQYKKHIFYRQVFDALYDRHDSTKGIGTVHEKKSKLDIEDFRKVLCAMGFVSMKIGMIEFDRDQMMDLINQSVGVFPEIETNANLFFSDILHAVPLFVEEGIKYKWAHKSFAEYFAAVFICRECKEYEEQILAEILLMENNQRFYNILDFCYDMDYKSIVNVLIYPVLCEFVNYYDNKSNGSEEDLCNVRIFNDFICKSYFIKIDDKARPKDRDIMHDFWEAIELFRKSVDDNFSFLTYLSRNENIILLTKRKNVYEIIKLMYRKGIDVFYTPRIKDYSLKFLKNLKVGVWDVSKDGEENEIMMKNQDAIVSSIFHSSFDFDRRVLDIKRCREKIDEFERERNTVRNSFFSLS